MKQTIIRIVICAILSGAIFSLITLITGNGNLIECFKDGVFCGAVYALILPWILKWRKKHKK